MRAYTLILLLLMAPFGFAESKTGTITGNETTESVSFQYGRGYLLLGAGAGQDFGSGTVTLQIRATDPSDGAVSWIAMETYTALPAPNPVVINLGGTSAVFRLSMAGATSPDLDWSLTEARTP